MPTGFVFSDLNNKYQGGYYDNVAWNNPRCHHPDGCCANNTTGNIDATLQPPAAPLAEISTDSGWGTVDPNTGQIIIVQAVGGGADISIRSIELCRVAPGRSA